MLIDKRKQEDIWDLIWQILQILEQIRFHRKSLDLAQKILLKFENINLWNIRFRRALTFFINALTFSTLARTCKKIQKNSRQRFTLQKYRSFMCWTIKHWMAHLKTIVVLLKCKYHNQGARCEKKKQTFVCCRSRCPRTFQSQLGKGWQFDGLASKMTLELTLTLRPLQHWYLFIYLSCDHWVSRNHFKGTKS